MPFHFSLQAVLHFRQSVEHQEELRQRTANQQVARVRRVMELADERIRREQEMRSVELQAGTTSAEVRFSVAAQDALRAQRQKLEAELQRLQILRDQQQRIFQQARRERDVIQSLRDRQILEYKRESARREQQRADELFLLRQSYLRHG